jgi:hypothetical protein
MAYGVWRMAYGKKPCLTTFITLNIAISRFDSAIVYKAICYEAAALKGLTVF